MEAEEEAGKENDSGTDPLAMLSKASDAELPNVLSEVTTKPNSATSNPTPQGLILKTSVVTHM